MIRRAFWLVLGAALGVTGYRRATRLVQSLRPQQAAQLVLRPPQSPVTGRQVLAGAARAGRGAVASAAFIRDVREGMAEYLDQHDSGTPRTLGSQQGGAGPGRPAP